MNNMDIVIEKSNHPLTGTGLNESENSEVYGLDSRKRVRYENARLCREVPFWKEFEKVGHHKKTSDSFMNWCAGRSAARG